MSVSFRMSPSNQTDYVQIDCQFILIRNLKPLLARKLSINEDELSIINQNTGKEYASNSLIKRGSSIRVNRKQKDVFSRVPPLHEIISNEQLQQMMQDCRFYMIKSSNEQNIQKARDCSVWATTFSNQEKLKSAYNSYRSIFLFFGTNRSYEIKGIARMETEPDKVADKAIWSGVNNIRLGGNFKIRWIRKKPLSLSQIEKMLGNTAKEEILRACDGNEVDTEICKKISLLFQLPTQPYYQPEKPQIPPKQPVIPVMVQESKKVNNFYLTPTQQMMNLQIPAMLMMHKSTNSEGTAKVDQGQNELKMLSEADQKTKRKRIKSKHKKRHKEERESQSDESEGSSESSSSSSSSSSSKRSSLKEKKIKKANRKTKSNKNKDNKDRHEKKSKKNKKQSKRKSKKNKHRDS